MLRYRRILMTACLVVLCMPAPGLAKNGMPIGAFITKPINSVQQFCDLIMQDERVAARYSKHFGMDTPALIGYFQDNLKVSTIKKSDRYLTWYISQYGRVVEHRKYLPAGSKILASFDGRPVILIACGNPLTKALPQKPVTKVEAVVQEIAPPPPPPAPLPAPVEVAVQPVPEPVVEVLAAPSMELMAIPLAFSSPITTSASSLASRLLGAVAVGALVKPSPKEVVPEPTSFLVLGIGGISFFCQYYKRSRRK